VRWWNQLAWGVVTAPPRPSQVVGEFAAGPGDQVGQAFDLGDWVPDSEGIERVLI
jgi:hypothetical protein